jgi:hypothetical protein
MTTFHKRRSPIAADRGGIAEASLSRSDHEEEIAALIVKRTPEALDDILSRELQQLSFVTRSEINEEVHGVRCLAPEETPELWRESLERLKSELEQLKSSGIARAYAQACDIPDSYIHKSKFQLKFLRAELFNSKKAAVRITTFLELYMEFFGPFILERPLQLSDLNKQDLEVLRGGDMQPLPFRDRSKS